MENRFDPVKAGFVLIDDQPRRWQHEEFEVGCTFLSISGRWFFERSGSFVFDPFSVTVPGDWDHDTVVALLRANGADIDEGGDDE